MSANVDTANSFKDLKKSLNQNNYYLDCVYNAGLNWKCLQNLYIINLAKNEKLVENNMMGMKALHDVEIDKDTIITRNMNPKRKQYETAIIAKSQDQGESRPDWSYSSFPHNVKNHVEQFKRNMSECLKEVQSQDKRQIKPLSPYRESPIHGECLIACVLKRNGVIENGKIHKKNLLSLVSKFYQKNEKLMKKLEKNVDRCIEGSVQNKDECAIASHLNDCTNDLMANNKHKIIVNY